MSPRLPFLVLLAGTAALGVRLVADEPTAGPTDRGEQEGPELPSVGAGAPSDEAARSSSTWFCAAGTVGASTDHVVVLDNPTDEAIDGRITPFLDGDPPPGGTPTGDAGRFPAPAPSSEAAESAGDPEGSADTAVSSAAGPSSPRRVTVPPGTEERVALSELVGSPPDGERFVAALVELDHVGVAVDHELTGDPGSSRAACAPGGATEWHLAWGTTARDARDVLVLFNPFPNDVVVDMAFATPDEVREPVRRQGMVVPAGRVVAVDVAEDVTRRDQVAATVRARAGSLVVERLEVFDGSLGRTGRLLLPGHPVPATAARFDGGELEEGDREILALYNPQETAAEVEVAVLPLESGSSAPEPFHLVVRQGRAQVLDLSAEDRVDPTGPYVVEVRSTDGTPVVVDQVRLGEDGSQPSSGNVPGSRSSATTAQRSVAVTDPRKLARTSPRSSTTRVAGTALMP